MEQPTVVGNNKLFNRNFVLILIVNFCSSISFQILTPTLPIYVEQHLGQPERAIGIVVGILTLTTILVRPFTGKAIDIWNRRNLCVAGMMICSVSIFLYQFPQQMSALIMLRLLHGIGWAMITTATVTIASITIPKERLGEGMGYYGLSTVFSIALAPALGLYIVDLWGFTELFIITSTLVFIGAVLGGTIKLHHTPLKTKINLPHMVNGLLEKTALKPSLVNFCISLTFSAIITFIAIYALQNQIENIGIFFTTFAITLLVIRPISGKWIDLKGFRVVMIPGLISIAIGIILLFFAQSLAFFIVAAVFYGLGYGSMHPSLQAMVVARSLPERRGAANSTLLLSSDFGFGIGAILWGLVADFTGYRIMYLLLLIPVFVAFTIHFFYQAPYSKNANVDVDVVSEEG
ncbi:MULTISPECIES: MFS transporter [Bacillaceae]|uniref:MFS transporter n=1 Tax=Evansella alkalicola TaxID=745819 RepID=A0ABS6JWQ4_9BACI|nr:MFS transporter [Litchfieldia alkalitelluris]MBU9723020.1 MFS transporter [Bacillus alkalicola]